MKALRAASWAAAVAVGLGAASVALIAALVPAHHVPEAIGGATYAIVGQGRAPRLVVTSLRTDGVEALAGLRVGDEVTTVDGIGSPTAAALRHAIVPGRAVALTVHRGGDAVAVTLLEARPKPGGETRFDEDPAGRGR